MVRWERLYDRHQGGRWRDAASVRLKANSPPFHVPGRAVKIDGMSPGRNSLSTRTALDLEATDQQVPDWIGPPANTLRLGKPAMASEFEVVLNAGSADRLSVASAALDLVDRLEDQISVYRTTSELSRLNARASHAAVPVEPRLFQLLCEAIQYARATEGAFDPTSGPLVALWRRCRRERRAPEENELRQARTSQGIDEVEFDNGAGSVRFRRAGMELNLNAMGKGYALDRAGEMLDETTSCAQSPDRGADVPAPSSSVPVSDWLLHGGHSSLLARGSLAGESSGWPINLRHPLFPQRSLGTIRLRDRGMSVSGSGVQFFRVGEKRYGHIIDPRTGWPAERMLTAIVLARTAAQAEALSTAFFVLGVEMAREYCHNHVAVAALLIPAPTSGRRIEPVNCGIPDHDLTLDDDL
ncbi:MAG: FAD:protein FMN transferase [Planctomycetaceae bacterium]